MGRFLSNDLLFPIHDIHTFLRRLLVEFPSVKSVPFVSRFFTIHYHLFTYTCGFLIFELQTDIVCSSRHAPTDSIPDTVEPEHKKYITYFGVNYLLGGMHSYA